jgi:hypothetical protein
VQIICYGPLLVLGVVLGALAVPRRVLAFWLAFGLPPLLTALILSGRGSSLPHWTAYPWLLLIPLAVVGLTRLRTTRLRAAVLGALAAFQVACVALLFGLILWGGPSPERAAQATAAPGERPDRSTNPITDLYGWDAAARQAQALAQDHGVSKLAVMNWALASRVAWYARPLPVYVVGGNTNQFTLWFGVLAPGDSAIVVDFSPATFAPPLGPNQFRSCRLLAQTPVVHGGRQLSHFSHQLCEGWQQPSPTHATVAPTRAP